MWYSSNASQRANGFEIRKEFGTAEAFKKSSEILKYLFTQLTIIVIYIINIFLKLRRTKHIVENFTACFKKFHSCSWIKIQKEAGHLPMINCLCKI